jgi:hypothetical protein
VIHVARTSCAMHSGRSPPNRDRQPLALAPFQAPPIVDQICITELRGSCHVIQHDSHALRHPVRYIERIAVRPTPPPRILRIPSFASV